MSVIYLPPLMPFLTSLFFRAGIISSNILFIIDGIIFVFGVIGLYLLLHERFNEIQSILGCLIFISFPLIYSWAVSGGIYVQGISFSIWLTYFTILALSVIIEKYKIRFKRESLKSWGLYVIIGLIFISSATALHTGHSFIHGYQYTVQSASDWLEDYNPNYQNENIYSNYDPHLHGHLKKK